MSDQGSLKKNHNGYNFKRTGVGSLQLFVCVCVCVSHIYMLLSQWVIVRESVAILFFDGPHDDDVCKK